MLARIFGLGLETSEVLTLEVLSRMLRDRIKAVLWAPGRPFLFAQNSALPCRATGAASSDIADFPGKGHGGPKGVLEEVDRSFLP